MGKSDQCEPTLLVQVSHWQLSHTKAFQYQLRRGKKGSVLGLALQRLSLLSLSLALV